MELKETYRPDLREDELREMRDELRDDFFSYDGRDFGKLLILRGLWSLWDHGVSRKAAKEKTKGAKGIEASDANCGCHAFATNMSSL